MTLINNLINKYGADKLLHFLGGAWIVSLFSPFAWYGLLIGYTLMIILSIVKEKYLDDYPDMKDILFANFGGITSMLIYVIVYILIL